MSTQKVIFCFEVPNISQRIESNKFTSNFCVWNVPWEIQVWKVVAETSESLGVKLLCLNQSNGDWGSAVTVTYRLCSFDDEVPSFEYGIHPKVVNNINNSILTSAFIKWDDLIDTKKLYVENDTIKMEFVIEVANPNRMDESVLQFQEIQSHCFTNFELSIKNTNNLWAVQSPNFDILHERYSLVVYKHEQHLDVELCKMNDVESCNRPMMLVKLISAEGDDKTVEQHSQFHTTQLISWNELHKPENGFIYDDTIKLEVKVMADAVFQEAKEFIQKISSASTLSDGVCPATVISMDASVTLDEPALPNYYFKEFSTATNTVTGCSFSQMPNTPNTTSRAPVPYTSTNLNGSVTSISAAKPTAPDGSELIFEKTFSDKSLAKFELSIKNANILTVVKSPIFVIRDKSYELIVQNLQDHFDIELKALRSDLRTQPIMLVKLVSSKGREKSIVQHTRFRTEKLISWKELQNPENGFNYDDLIKVEVVIVKSSIDLNVTKKFIKFNILRSVNLSVCRFCIEVPKMRKFDCVSSPDLNIHGVSWKVSLSKETINGKQSLAVYLYCNEDIPSKRFYAVSFSVKLISFNDNVTALENHCEPYAFSRGGLGYGCSLIDWEDLVDATKCYVKDDKIILDMKINFDDPKTTAQAALAFNDISNSSADDQRKYKITIENVDSLVAVKSPPFDMQNIQSDLQVYRHQDNLGVVLYHVRKIPLSVVVDLLPSKGEAKSVIQVQNTDPEGSIPMRALVMTWSELFNPENRFVNNNSITLEVTISENIEHESVASKLASLETTSETRRERLI